MEVKKLSPEKIQAIVENMLVGISQEARIKILTELVLICIKTIDYAHRSHIPGTISQAEGFLSDSISRLEKRVRERKL